MKTYVIFIDTKTGISVHKSAFTSKNEALDKCRQMAGEFVATLARQHIDAEVSEYDRFVRVARNGTTLHTYMVDELELNITDSTRGQVEVLPWEEEIVFYATKGPKGNYFKIPNPKGNAAICYIDATAFNNNNYICFTEKQDSHGDFFYTLDMIRNAVSSFIPGNDVGLIHKMALHVLEKAEGESIQSILESEKTALEDMVADAYGSGSRAYLLPYNKDDEQRPVTVMSYDNCDEILVVDDKGIDQEVTLSEVYRRSDRKCPKCGQPLYHEKYANEMGYPYVCFECDENFFGLETE